MPTLPERAAAASRPQTADGIARAGEAVLIDDPRALRAGQR